MDKQDAARRRLLVAAKRWGKAKNEHRRVFSSGNFDVVEASLVGRQLSLAEKALLRAVEGLDG